MGRIILGAILLSTALGTAACKQSGQLTMQSDAPGPTTTTLSMVEGAEFVSSGQQGTSAVDHYTIQSSVGDFYSDVQQTSSGNATLFSTVEGQMISTLSTQ